MRVTRNNISKAIAEKTGLNVELIDANGYFYFASNDEATALRLASCFSMSVFTNHLTALTIDQWVESFIDLISV